MKYLPLALVTAIAFAGQLGEGKASPSFNSFNTDKLYSEIDHWLQNEIVSVSITAQNERYGRLAEAQILELDHRWRSEKQQGDQPLIAATVSNPLSVYLTRMQGQSYGLFVEIFIMDQNGLNVGQSSVTSDFWQGDEAKFQKTFDVGPDAIFVDEPEWDNSFQIWRVQVNKSLG